MRKVIINIGEKDYEIKFDINALIDLAGDGIDVLKIDKIEMDLKAIRTMFKHGLKHDMKKITDKQAGDLMSQFIEDGHQLNDLTVKIIEALANAMGNKKEIDEEVEEGEEGK